MTTYTRPLTEGTPTTGQVVKAGHVNEPIDQIYDTILAGGITADQIAVGAVDTSELATAAVTAAKMDGTLPDASAMATSAAPTTDAQLANKKYVDDNTVWVPTVAAGYAGEQSVTFPNGLIFKIGIESVAGNATDEITFDVAFPNNVVAAFASYSKSGDTNVSNPCTAVRKTGSEATVLQITNGNASVENIAWIAWGF